jgi:hypothetical protein
VVLAVDKQEVGRLDADVGRLGAAQVVDRQDVRRPLFAGAPPQAATTTSSAALQRTFSTARDCRVRPSGHQADEDSRVY